MWKKIKEKGKLFFYALYFNFGIGLIVYTPIDCGFKLVKEIQNPPSKIYAKNQTLGKWDTFCIDGESEDGCDFGGYRLKTKSKIGALNKVPVPIITVIEVDEIYEKLSITLRDWNTGEIIQPYPQEKHKWYEFNKKFDSFETIGTLIDEDGNDIKSFELTLMNDKIIITNASCDSRGFEENNNNVKGGCFFLDEYEKNRDEWHNLEILLKDNRKVLVSL